MPMLNFVPIHPGDVERFHRLSENSDLLMALKEKFEDHGYFYEISNSCGDIFSLDLW